MQINSVNSNKYTNPNFSAQLSIIGNAKLLPKNGVANLTQKAKALGTSKDFITLSIRDAEHFKDAKMNVFGYFEDVFTVSRPCTLVNVAHSMADGISGSYKTIDNFYKAFGSKSERSKKTYEAIDQLLDNIQADIAKNG